MTGKPIGYKCELCGDKFLYREYDGKHHALAGACEHINNVHNGSFTPEVLYG